MAHRLERLFTQAAQAETTRHAAPRCVPPPLEDEEPALAADPSEPERILTAFQRGDWAGCLALPAVTLDALGRPHWPVTDRHVRRCVCVRVCSAGRALRLCTAS